MADKPRGFQYWAVRILTVLYLLAALFSARFVVDQNADFWNRAFGYVFYCGPSLMVFGAVFFTIRPGYWITRILSIFFVLCMMVFSLDVFDEKLGFWGTVFGLFMHNLPALVLLAGSILAWKYQLAGAVVYNVMGLLYVFWLLHFPHPFLNAQNPLPGILSGLLMLYTPAFIIGNSFLMDWLRKRQALPH